VGEKLTLSGKMNHADDTFAKVLLNQAEQDALKWLFLKFN
jgi:hypothetical protein